MNNIKNTFSIKDLENLSGIKAHTIRIWEKRYTVLEPMRTDSNIRLYDSYNLQKLLNIKLLTDYGYKISRISKLSNENINALVREIISEKSTKDHAFNAFKLAMMQFNQSLFFNTYNRLLAEKSFRNVFYEIFIPLINEIGLLWQTNTISIAHEHFISFLIKQKLLSNIEKIQLLEPTNKERVFVLFLPQNEIHDLGLMYINYEILLKGYKSIFLGESISVDAVKDMLKYFDNITFITYMTIAPTKDEMNDFIVSIKKELLEDKNTNCWCIGKMTEYIYDKHLNPHLKIFKSIESLVEIL